MDTSGPFPPNYTRPSSWHKEKAAFCYYRNGPRPPASPRLSNAKTPGPQPIRSSGFSYFILPLHNRRSNPLLLRQPQALAATSRASWESVGSIASLLRYYLIVILDQLLASLGPCFFMQKFRTVSPCFRCWAVGSN